MKKFTKRLLSCVAVAAIAASMAAPAFADGEVTAEWDNATSKLTVKSNYTADQKTLLVVPSTTDLTDIQDPDAVIKQIDQQAGTYYTAAGVEVPTKALADGTYTVYMGGDGNVYHDDFRVGAGSDRILGDVNGNDEVAINDATQIVNHKLGKKLLTGEDLIAADCNDNGEVAINDATQIVNFKLNKASNIDGVKTIATKKEQTVK